MINENTGLATTTVDTTSKNLTGFRGKSTFIPPNHRNASIDTYCGLVEQDVENAIKKRKEYKVHNNLSKEEREALNNFLEKNTLIVKNADKGGTIVIQIGRDYEKEVYRQLGDTNYHKKLSGNPTITFKNETHQLFKKRLDNGLLTKEEFDF